MPLGKELENLWNYPLAINADMGKHTQTEGGIYIDVDGLVYIHRRNAI